jgi:hypothetical protein
VALAKTLNGAVGRRMVLLTDRELEPFDIYSRHEDENGGLLYGRSIDQLALNSERIFPGLGFAPRLGEQG